MKTRAERLFDQIIKIDEYRPPLTLSDENSIQIIASPSSEDRFDFYVPTQNLKIKTARRLKKKIKEIKCTPAALAEAFAKANLPDYEALYQYPLNIVSRPLWDVKKPFYSPIQTVSSRQMCSTPLTSSKPLKRLSDVSAIFRPNQNPNMKYSGLNLGLDNPTVHSVWSGRVSGQVIVPDQSRKLWRKTVVSSDDPTSQIFMDTLSGDEKNEEERVLAFCHPQHIISFSRVKIGVEPLLKKLGDYVVKVGEGSYAEVFKTRCKNGEIVFKIISFNSTLDRDHMFATVLPELAISFCFEEMKRGEWKNTCENFINFQQASCVKGQFPEQLIEEWERYDELSGSENNHPGIYNSEDLHMLLFCANGGLDLEKYKLSSAQQALAIFLQIIYSLAAAECEIEFEHRDLHWGNILVMEEKKRIINYTVDGRKYIVPSHGVKASIIDFTLSRISKSGFIIYDDLEKYEDLFVGQGDYQFEIYRKMRTVNGKNWTKFSPETNILWCHYVLHKLIDDKVYTSRSRVHKTAFSTLVGIREGILQYNSAAQAILKFPLLASYKVQKK